MPFAGCLRSFRNADGDSRMTGAPSFAPPTPNICSDGLARVAFWPSEEPATGPAERANRLIGRLMARKGEMGAVRNLDLRQRTAGASCGRALPIPCQLRR